MDLDCPAYAVALWVEGDNFVLRLPDRQTVTVPLAQPQRLVSVLKARRAPKAQLKAVGDPACPTQWDLERRPKPARLTLEDLGL